MFQNCPIAGWADDVMFQNSYIAGWADDVMFENSYIIATNVWDMDSYCDCKIKCIQLAELVLSQC
jgi:hypothetical protein